MTDDMKPGELVRRLRAKKVMKNDWSSPRYVPCELCAEAADWIEAHASTPEDDGGRRWRHVKRGTEYVEIGRAEMQIARVSPSEGTMLVIYRGEDGKLWARTAIEFEDGRFVELRPLPDPPIRSRQEPRA